MHISFAGKKIRLLALAVTIFMIIFVSANWRLYLDPTLDLTCGTILFVLSLLAGPDAGILIMYKPSVDDNNKKQKKNKKQNNKKKKHAGSYHPDGRGI